RAVLRKQGYTDQEIKEARVLSPNIEGYILFPWADEYGRPLTLFGTWQTRTPPPGTPKKRGLEGKGSKRSPLYFDQTRRAGHQEVVVVEGLTDAGLAQVRGDTRVVACVGAELSRLQVETLARHNVQRVTIALDPDKAGDTGILSCIKSLARHRIPCYIAPKL